MARSISDSVSAKDERGDFPAQQEQVIETVNKGEKLVWDIGRESVHGPNLRRFAEVLQHIAQQTGTDFKFVYELPRHIDLDIENYATPVSSDSWLAGIDFSGGGKCNGEVIIGLLSSGETSLLVEIGPAEKYENVTAWGDGRIERKIIDPEIVFFGKGPLPGYDNKYVFQIPPTSTPLVSANGINEYEDYLDGRQTCPSGSLGEFLVHAFRVDTRPLEDCSLIDWDIFDLEHGFPEGEAPASPDGTEAHANLVKSGKNIPSKEHG